VGGASRVRELFELANKNSPCIIFIDEIDAIGRDRATGRSLRVSAITRTSCWWGWTGSTRGRIFLIGATNRADLLDPALVRPGRWISVSL
jgi:cell division protease FtsH